MAEPNPIGDDDSGTNIEPLTDLLKLLAEGGGSFFDDEDTGRHTASEPLPIPMPPSWAASKAGPGPAPPHKASGPEPSIEMPYRPTNRPPVPIVTVLDDGNATRGEVVRLREASCLIGRTEGTITIPHDPRISSRHAELIRDGLQPPYKWYLRDVGSRNGTFVCCKSAPLRPDRIVIIGSRRFRLHLPHFAAVPPPTDDTVAMSHLAGLSTWPMLVETTVPVNPLCIRLVGSRLSVGRPGCGNQIEIEDPLLAKVHAVITQTSDGQWWIQATPSHNGLWIQVCSIPLTHSCRFQCGEQRFLFELR